MKFDLQKHHCRSVRMKGFDYIQPGSFIITMVTFRRGFLFGGTVDGEMRGSATEKILL